MSHYVVLPLSYIDPADRVLIDVISKNSLLNEALLTCILQGWIPNERTDGVRVNNIALVRARVIEVLDGLGRLEDAIQTVFKEDS